jgi:nitrite reductase (NADH) large subunit
VSAASLDLVVVGNGMVSHRLCERLAALDHAGRYRVTVLGEESRAAYDRVHLSDFFGAASPDQLALASPAWYADRSIALHLRERVTAIDRTHRLVRTHTGRQLRYDRLVLATGSAPFVPPIPGASLPGVFVYRTIDDLEAIAAWGRRARRAAVIGGGLLGLEAAKAAHDMGLETHVVEFAPRLMPRQVDAGGGRVLLGKIKALGVHCHLDVRTDAILGDAQVETLRFAGGEDLPVDMVIVSAGIRPRDELARASGIVVGERGGVVVDDHLRTSDPDVFAVGEVALHAGMIYGLVGPGYQMADTLALHLTADASSEHRFSGADTSTKLKLLGIDVASFGDPFTGADPGRTVVFEDSRRGVYQKLVLSTDRTRLQGGILVGDADAYMTLLNACRDGKDLPERLEELLFGVAAQPDAADVGEDVQICSCNNVTKGEICAAIRAQELTSVSGVKACTKAGTGCGGCVPFVASILAAELARAGREVDTHICEHFPYTRRELFEIIKINRSESFDAAIASHGRGHGCEICRPVVASILASTWNDLIVNHDTIQDTNDRFLANIQRGGTYSVIPRVPGGEITPEKLIVLGQVAKKYDLYCKITGGQRIDLLGARVSQLPDIWEELVDAGFESGHAYGKAMRTVKSCIGTTWCRFGVQDSVGFAIRVEERYRGIRAPHKLKSAVSGCIRECAEAQNKDFGIIATEKGWNLYLCGNGGSSPRHGDLFAADIPEELVIKYIDRFLMYYIYTANPLQRTARWLESLDGGIEYLKQVVIDDSLGICTQLEADMQKLIDSYQCEWAAVVKNPERRAKFAHFVNASEPDNTLEFVRERGQRRPAAWPQPRPVASLPKPPVPIDAAADGMQWVYVAPAASFPHDGGSTMKYGRTQIAVFNFASRGEWYATQAVCPHRLDSVLGRGLLGDQGGEPKVACPLHKRTFSLRSGQGLSDADYAIETFPVEVRQGEVYVKLPLPAVLEERLPCRPGLERGAA